MKICETLCMHNLREALIERGLILIAFYAMKDLSLRNYHNALKFNGWNFRTWKTD